MHRVNSELVAAGVVLAADGLQPTSKGKRVVGLARLVRDVGLAGERAHLRARAAQTSASRR